MLDSAGALMRQYSSDPIVDNLIRSLGDLVAERLPVEAFDALREVAQLVAGGLTNPQIARELVIGERTVDTHVENVLHKLGFSSRAQVAAWVTERRLRAEAR